MGNRALISCIVGELLDYQDTELLSHKFIVDRQTDTVFPKNKDYEFHTTHTIMKEQWFAGKVRAMLKPEDFDFTSYLLQIAGQVPMV